jgi:hypothetical protein
MALDTAIDYDLENPGFESRKEQCIIFSKNVQTGPGTHPGSYSMGTEIISSRKTYRGVTLTTQLHLTPG